MSYVYHVTTGCLHGILMYFTFYKRGIFHVLCPEHFLAIYPFGIMMIHWI